MDYTDLYIDGEWRTRRGERFDVINPATEEVLASVASADIADADAALDAAEPPWPTGPRRSRASARRCCARRGN
jgi:succinate-semialdehyde dehydrogenase/glutarate-semialdehyde dehydrogenase